MKLEKPIKVGREYPKVTGRTEYVKDITGRSDAGRDFLN